jgi:hypothetical protein
MDSVIFHLLIDSVSSRFSVPQLLYIKIYGAKIWAKIAFPFLGSTRSSELPRTRKLVWYHKWEEA